MNDKNNEPNVCPVVPVMPVVFITWVPTLNKWLAQECQTRVASKYSLLFIWVDNWNIASGLSRSPGSTWLDVPRIESTTDTVWLSSRLSLFKRQRKPRVKNNTRLESYHLSSIQMIFPNKWLQLEIHSPIISDGRAKLNLHS